MNQREGFLRINYIATTPTWAILKMKIRVAHHHIRIEQKVLIITMKVMGNELLQPHL